MKGTRQIIMNLKNEIREENEKINNLYKQIDEYEVIRSIAIQNRGSGSFYREKIAQCYLDIEKSIEKIVCNKDAITNLKKAEEIIKRGEICA